MSQGLTLAGMEYRARGQYNLPSTGALLLINHQSFLDPVLVGLPLKRPVSYLTRDTLFTAPGVGFIMRNCHTIPISRTSTGTASLREAVRRMDEGYLVGIFPEGTRCRDGLLQEFKPGFLAMIKRSTVPVIPVAVAGAYRAMPRNAWMIRPARVRVVYGERLNQSVIDAYRAGQKGLDMVDLAHTAVAKCLHEAEDWLNS